MLSALAALAQQQMSLQEARQYLDSAPIDPIEGIWHSPDDGVDMLFIKEHGAKGRYSITVLQCDDGTLLPGERLGHAELTAEPGKYIMNLFTKRNRKGLTLSKKCVGTLTAEGTAMKVSAPGWKLFFNALFFLPGFWKVAHMTYDNPTRTAAPGLFKTYPSYDGNGSSLFSPVWL